MTEQDGRKLTASWITVILTLVSLLTNEGHCYTDFSLIQKIIKTDQFELKALLIFFTLLKM